MTKLLLIGPLVVFAALAAAEAAAAGLAQWPSSEMLWYLNLEVFGFLQQTHYAVDVWPAPCAQLLLIGTPILATAILGQLAGLRLLLAIASNLSFVFAGLTVYCNALAPSAQAASSEFIASQPGSYLQTS
jgi:hypothetical protein